MKNVAIYDLFNPAPAPVLASITEDKQKKDATSIDGLSYHPEFITPEEESELIMLINDQEWLGDLKRRVQHYGWKYDYRARSLNKDMYLGPLPVWIQRLAERLVDKQIIDELPDQVIINEYKPGQGIANHVDCEPCFGNSIISLSFGTPCIMNFIDVNSKNKIETVLEPRSAICIKNEARYQWSHGIPLRLADDINGVRTNRGLRISMTFRKVIV